MKTKHSCTIFLFCLIYSINCLSQYVNFPTDSTIWCLARQEYNPDLPTVSWNEIYTLNGDTIVNNVSFIKIFKDDQLYGLLREFEKRIYYIPIINEFSWNSFEEIILYDFNLEIGDAYNLQQLNNQGTDTIYYESTVTGIDSILLNNGEWRKRIKLTNWGNFCSPLYWIEGIGGSEHPIHIINFCNDFTSEIACLEINNEEILGQNCQKLETSIYSVNDFNLKIYPNPTYSEIIIDTDENITNFEIYDLTGKQIINGIIERNLINVNNLKNGIYILKLRNNEKYVNLKFIKI